jgi:hypothetical protein
MAEQIERIVELKAEGKTPKEIGEELGISPQKVGTEFKKYELSLLDEEESTEQVNLPEVNDNGCYTFKASEYEEYSKANGRTAFGGKVGKKVKATKEELRALINSYWTPSRVMEKFQMDEDDLMKLVVTLSHAELRDKLIVCNFKLDFFR